MVKQGYKQTEIGVIPEKWETVKLNDCCSFLGGGTPPKNILEYWEGTIPWVSSSDLCNNDVYSINVNRYITEKAIAMSATNKCPAGTVLVVSRVGVGKVALSTCEICTSQDFTNIIPEKHNALFLSYVLVPIMINKANEAQGTSIKGVTTEEIKQTTVIFPPIAEQQLITETLSDVDGMISSLEKLIAKKKAVKQGAMQELLTGKKRLSGYTGEWVEKNVEDIVIRFATGLNPRQNFKLNDGGINYYVTIKDFKDGRLFLDDECDRIDDVALARINERSDLRKNDLLFSSIGRIGDAYLITETPQNWNINESVFALRPNTQLINPLMLYYLLTSDSVKRRLTDSTTGSTLKSIKLGHLKKISCVFPKDLNEQVAIAAILSDIDNEIEALEQKLAKTRELKQGMMQQLLTGKIRLV